MKSAITQERAQSLLGPHLPALGGCFLKAEQDWLTVLGADVRKDCSDTLKAMWYWNRAHVHAKAAFAGISAVRPFQLGGVRFLSVADEVWVRLKKGTDHKGTVGYPTEQRLTLSSQGHLEQSEEWEQATFDWGGPRPILVAGYILDPFGRIKELFIAHPVGERNNAWDFPIGMDAALAFQLPAAEPETPAVASTQPSVRLKVE
jgi:hypothetical protein